MANALESGPVGYRFFHPGWLQVIVQHVGINIRPIFPGESLTVLDNRIIPGCKISNMRTLSELREILREQEPTLEEKYGVRVIGVFGSYVRNEQSPDSDLDVLIELDRPPKISLIGLVELEQDLSDLLGIRVDIAIQKNLKKRIGQRILQEVVPI